MAVKLAELAGPTPHALLAGMRARAPVAWCDDLGGWLVTSHAEAEQVLRDTATFTVDDPRFSTARLTGPSMLTTDGREHARHRGAFAGDYRPAVLRGQVESFIRNTAEHLVSNRLHPNRLEVRSEVAEPLAVATLDHFLRLGVPVERVAGWYRGLATGFEIDDGLAGRLPLIEDLSRVAAQLAAHTPRNLSVEELTGNLAITLLGGVETVEGTICQAIRCRYDEGTREAAHRVGLPAAIEESIRLEPAAARLDRYATIDTNIDIKFDTKFDTKIDTVMKTDDGGTRISAGDLMIVSISAANRDPLVFEQPDRFDGTRENLGRHLGFGTGAHFCLGVHLARLEAREAVRAIEAAFPQAVIDDEQSDPVQGLIFRKPQRLSLKAVR